MIPVEPLDSDLTVKVSVRTVPVKLTVSGNHSELLFFYVVEAMSPPVILDFPLLCRHPPHIEWVSGWVLSWSPYFLMSAALIRLSVRSLPHPEAPDHTTFPPEYHDIRDVFCKT